MKKAMLVLAMVGALAMSALAPAMAQSSNPDLQVAADTTVCGEVTLTFSNDTNWLFAFEYRADDEETPYPGFTHPITKGEYWNIVNVAADDEVEVTVEADDHVDYRLALGPESDWFFYGDDAVRVEVEPCLPGADGRANGPAAERANENARFNR